MGLAEPSIINWMNDILRHMRTMVSGRLGAFLTVSRANLLLTSAGHATLGLFLGAGTVLNLVSTSAVLFVALHYLIAVFACNINTYFDYDVDKKYKTQLSDGVDTVGRDVLSRIMFLEAVIIFFMISIMALLGHGITAMLAIFGLLFAWAYSAEPVRMKKRGIWSPVPLIFGLYILPILGGWFVFRETLTVPFAIFSLGYLLMNQGFTFVNTVEDYSEDRSEGIVTWAHIFGMRRTLDMAFFLSFFGILSSFSISYLAYQKLDTTWGLLAFLVSLVASASILLATMEVGEAGLGRDPEKSAKKYAVRLQRWFIMGRFPLMLAALLLLL